MLACEQALLEVGEIERRKAGALFPSLFLPYPQPPKPRACSQARDEESTNYLAQSEESGSEPCTVAVCCRGPLLHPELKGLMIDETDVPNYICQ